MTRSCPLCGGCDTQRTVRRERVPIFQNVVYATHEAAVTAPQALFELATCRRCGFSYNGEFDSSLVNYDANYDNHVASAAFRAYYRDVASMLIDRFRITDGTVYDIGCGKGEFLRIFCELAPGVRGVGIDPSCTPVMEGNFELRRATFETSRFDSDARLVVLRHVLEHIEQPRAFLTALRAAMPSTPLYVEVPDLTWILDNRAFWDFCYEHCNYFTPAAMRHALELAAFDVVEQSTAFGDQYQWSLGIPAEAEVSVVHDVAPALAAIEHYWTEEKSQIERLREQADRCGGLTIWGMATKGVLLAVILGADRIRGGIDMNRGKQFRFAAGSGVMIRSPDWLATLPSAAQVLAMNPNYADEIRAIASAIRSDIRVVAM